MKNWIFIVCFTMLVKPLVPVLEYAVNYEYISTKLCVNKDKPAKGCNGKCYLMKQLAAASEAEKPASQDKKHAAPEVADLFIVEPANYALLVFSTNPHLLLNAPDDLYLSRSTHPVFRPPIIS